MMESKEFRRTVMPLIAVNSIFCTGLVEYFTDQTTQAIGFAYATFSLTSFCSLFYYFMILVPITRESRMTSISVFMMYFQICHNSLVYVLTIIAGLMRRKRIRLSMRQLQNCTRAMDELGISGSYCASITHKYCVILFSSILIISTVVGELLWYINGYENCLVIIIYCIIGNMPPVVSFIIDFSFAYWIRYTKIKLWQLNMVLRSMLTTTLDSPQHRRVFLLKDKWKNNSSFQSIYRNYKASENVRKLKRIKEIYLELIKFARNTNEAYAFHILVSMATCFVIITTLLYNSYASLVSGKFTWETTQLYVFILWIIFYGLDMFAINHACQMTAMERCLSFVIFPHATTTGDILYELYEPSASKEFRDEVRNFILLLVQNPLTFSAYGFFDLDHTFIHDTIGSVTTYLVILIQVGHGSKKGPLNVILNSTSTI